MVSFQINAEALQPSESFPYLERTIAYNSSNLPTVYQNLRKAQRQWGVITRVLANTEATVRSQMMIYKAVSQSVLLYGSDI